MIKALKAEIGKNIIGKQNAIEQLTIALLAEGHVLIEDLPGVGKTTLAKAFSHALKCDFKRLQFTPDLMPSDVVGVTIYNKKTENFEFKKGPVFTHIMLADEINRTSPKTQSGLLEAMEEGQVTMDGKSYVLKKPFMVIATENTLDMQGTFPLPEAQQDRFMMRIHLGYPDPHEEIDILDKGKKPFIQAPISTPEEVQAWIDQAKNIHVSPALKKYIVSLCQATRKHPSIKLGASPRASIHLYHASRAKALLKGREYVIPTDITTQVQPILAHRLKLNSEAIFKGYTAETILNRLMDEIPIPMED